MQTRNRLFALGFALGASAIFVCAAEETGADVVLVAEATNPKPDELPTVRVVREKLWGKYYPMVSMRFPNVPDFQCDAWCYEAAVDFLDAKPVDGGGVEMRHRDQNHPGTLVVTTVTPRPGSVEFSARVVLDTANHAGAALPPVPPGLNLCWQLRHAPAFASTPDPYPQFVGRCFIFTNTGFAYLKDTHRAKIPVQPPDHEYNSPPWVQSYISASRYVPVTPPTSWAGYSTDRFLTPVIGAVSRDGRYLAAIANDSAESMAQAWHDCMHNNPSWVPADAPVTEQRWRLVVYAMENNPNTLMESVAADFPKEKWPAAAAARPTPPAGWKAYATRAGWIEVPECVAWRNDLPLGPFVRLADGGVLGIHETEAIISRDDGATWESHPLAASTGHAFNVRPERALIRTANGAIVLVFMDDLRKSWRWNAEKSLPEPGTHLPTCSIRSLDEGKTWTDYQVLYDGYSGDIHSMIQTRAGTLVAPVQELLFEDGRHALRPRYSTDDGKTWQRANLLDIGGRGHHDGLIEGTVAELEDKHVWMLCRTNLGRFWSASSDDDGKNWRVLTPSLIEASSAPGTLTRTSSGRLMLAWNRLYPEGSNTAPDDVWEGGDRQWSEVRANNYRAELSLAFSSDHGASWTKPFVVARRRDAPGASLAYTYVFEHKPGEFWLTTMQGDLRLAFREQDVVR